MSELYNFQKERIAALEKEVIRLNSELIYARTEIKTYVLQLDKSANKIKVSNPIFLKPLEQVETNYGN